MAPGTRQVMEMCEADGCKTVGNDGNCGELGECLPHLAAFKSQPQNTVRTKQNLLAGLRGRQAAILRPLEEGEDVRTRTAPRKTHV